MIRKFLTSFFFFIPLLCAADPIPANDIGTLTNLAKKFRPNSSYQKDDLHHPKEVFDRLSFFGAHGNLKIPISILISKVLNCNRNTYTIVDSKTTPLHGKSKDEVFFILDNQETLCYIVKAFCYQNLTMTRFLAELSGMALIRDRHLPHVDAVTPLAMGKCKWQGTNYVLLLESAAPGNRLDRIILSIQAFPKGDTRRSKRLSQVAQIMETVGTGLAELQGFDRKARATLYDSGIMAIEQALYQLSKEPFKLKGLGLKKLKSFSLRQVKYTLRSYRRHAYLHGDANPANTFYDSKHNRAILIDVYRIHRTVNAQGHPIGHGYYDLINFHTYLERLGRPHLTEEEMQHLVVSLYKGYAGQHPKECLCKKNDSFCSVLSNLVKPSEQEYFEQNLHYLKKYLQNSK